MVGPRTSEAAVSSVIGTVLMLGITVSVFAGVSIVVLGQFEDADETPRSELGILRGDGAYLLQHRGGDAIRLVDGSLLVGVGAVAREVPLTDLASDTADGEWWRLGETLCVSCLFVGQDVTGVQFVTDATLLLNEGIVPSARLVDGIDLRVDAPEADPDGLRAGQSTLLRARVTNVGREATVAAVSMEVLVDDVSVGSTAGTPLDGGTAQWLEVPWTATTGAHTVRFVAGGVAETDETNNEDTLALVVVANVADPGFAFQDVNLDGRFGEVDGDIAIDRAELSDGSYTVADPAHGLVVPASWGPLSAPSIQLQAARVEVHGDLTAQGGALAVTATAGDVVLGGDLSTLTSGGSVTVQATGGAVSAPGTLVRSSGPATVQGASVDLAGADVYLLVAGHDLALTATTGPLLLDDAIVEARGAVTASAATLLSAPGVDLDLLTAGEALSLSGAALDLVDATVHTRDDATLTATGDMDLTDLLLRLQGAGYLSVTAGGTLTATDADLSSVEGALVSGGTLAAAGLLLADTGGSVSVLSTVGALGIPGSVIQAGGAVFVSGVTGVDATDASITTTGNNVNVKVESAGDGHVDVRGATVVATKSLTLQVVDTNTVPNTWRVYVEGATFHDSNDVADVVPDEALEGSPAPGGGGAA